MHIRDVNIFTGRGFVHGDISLGDTVESVERKSGKGDKYVLPGLVDIHTHGGGGDDFSDGDRDGLLRLDRYYLTRGVTSYLATTMTIDRNELRRAVTEIGKAKLVGLKGIHLEGPFINPAKCGAQPVENVLAPSAELFYELNKASGNKIKLVTVAPEMDGAMDFIRKVSRTCAVSLGHTNADFETAMAAFKAGATHVTHLFNAMPPLLHRSTGVIGAAIEAGASVELICDGLHVHPPAIKAAFRMFGSGTCLISDSLRCAGMPDGEYTLGGNPIFMTGQKATLKDGTLAGSSISLLDEIKRATSFGVPLNRAVYAATIAPKRAIGLDEGALKVGDRADAVVLDCSLNLIDVIVSGKSVVV